MTEEAELLIDETPNEVNSLGGEDSLCAARSLKKLAVLVSIVSPPFAGGSFLLKKMTGPLSLLAKDSPGFTRHAPKFIPEAG